MILSKRLVLASITGLVLSAAFFIVFREPVALVFALAAPFLALGLEALSLESRAVERAKLVEADLPFLALWAWLFERGGVGGLRTALEEAESSRLLPGAAADSKHDIPRLAENHPSAEARRFYRYYLAIEVSGGDTAAYLRDTLRLYIEDIRDKALSYADSALTIGTTVLGAISLSYIASIMGGFIGGPDATLPVALVATVFGYVTLHSIQPRLREKPPTRLEALAAGAALTLALPVLLLLGPLYAVAAALVPPTLAYITWRKRIDLEEKALPATLRLIIERLRSTEKPMAELLLETADEVEEPLAQRLREAALKGTTRSFSWITRYTLYTLRRIIPRAGAADALALEQLYDLVTAYVAAHRRAASRLKSLAGLTVITPSIGYVAAKLLSKLTFGESYAPGFMISFSAIGKHVLLLDAVTAALTMGIVTAKAISYTARNTAYALAATLALLLASLLFPC